MKFNKKITLNAITLNAITLNAITLNAITLNAITLGVIALSLCIIYNAQNSFVIVTTQHTEKVLSLSKEELDYVDYLTAAGAPDVASAYVDMLSSYKRYEYSPVNTLFLGDSITQGLPTQDMFSMRTVNRGIGGDTVEGITARLERIAELNPKRVFLMVGVNNFYYEEEIFQGKYDALLSKAKKLMPDTEFYLQSILPVDVNIRPDISNSHLNLLNETIKNLAGKYQMTYIDLFSEMVDETGNIPADYVKDGLHLTDKGVYRWFELIEDYVNSNKASHRYPFSE